VHVADRYAVLVVPNVKVRMEAHLHVTEKRYLLRLRFSKA
jgi:hypothetical protein